MLFIQEYTAVYVFRGAKGYLVWKRRRETLEKRFDIHPQTASSRFRWCARTELGVTGAIHPDFSGTTRTFGYISRRFTSVSKQDTCQFTAIFSSLYFVFKMLLRTPNKFTQPKCRLIIFNFCGRMRICTCTFQLLLAVHEILETNFILKTLLYLK